MKNLFKITCLVALFAATAGSLQAQQFGYVNSAAILAEMPEVKQADANLEALQKQLQKRYKKVANKKRTTNICRANV